VDYQPLLDRFRADLTTLKNKIIALTQISRPSAKYADTADTLEGQTVTAVRAALAQPLADHLAASNPHEDSPESLGMPSKAYTDQVLNNLIPSGILPLSRFGSSGYLPVGVSGSFESGTHMGGYGFMAIPILIEDDGTLVYLRNATDGASRGVYYAYLANARTEVLTNTILTNRKYRPAFIPTGKEVILVCRGNKDALVGVIADTGTTNNPQFFVALTNGTMDDTKHVGAVFPTSVYNPATASGAPHLAVEPIIVGDQVYFLRAAGAPGAGAAANPMTIDVWKVPLADIQNNAVTSFASVTGWNCTGFKSTKTAQTNIRLADKIGSTVASDDAMITYPASGLFGTDFFAGYGNSAMTYSNKDPASNKVRVQVFGAFRQNPTASSSITIELTFSVVIDPVALTAVVDTPFQGGTTMQPTAALNAFDLSNVNFRAAGAAWITPGGIIYGGKSLTVTDDGYAFGFMVSNVTEQTNVMYRYKPTNFTTPYALIADASAGVLTGGGSAQINSKGPGPVMNGIRGVSLLPDGYLNMVSKGDGYWRWNICKYKDSGETPTTVYKSVSGADFLGYSPKTDRRWLSDISGAAAQYGLLTEIDVNGNITACRGSILTTARLSRTLDFDKNMVGSGTVSVTAASLTALSSAAWTAAGMTGTPKATWAQLIVPKNVNYPPVALLWYIGPDGTTYMLTVRVTVQARSGAVGTVGYVALINKYTGPVTTATGWSSVADGLAWGCQITEFADGYGYTLGGQVAWPKTGGTYLQQVKFWMNLDLSTEGFATFDSAGTYSTLGYFSIPGLGAGTLRNDGNDSDFYSKLEFQPFGAGKANFVNIPAQDRTKKIVILSQQVATGFIVYFTEDTPLFISGAQYTLPQQAIDLATITPSPANKTFYIYAQLQQGKPVYVIRETEIADSDTNMYLGYLQTTSLGIGQIVVNKVDRIDTYRLSTTPVGGAIPVSNGNPADPGTVSW